MGQLLSWALLIGPWLILIPLDSKRVKQFLSVGFLAALLSSIYFQIADIWNWWKVVENVPFLNNISSFTYGLLPVTTIIVFYFTNDKTLLFFVTNLVIDAIQAFIISPFIFEKANLYYLDKINNFGLYLVIISVVPIIYVYQKIYERNQASSS